MSSDWNHENPTREELATEIAEAQRLVKEMLDNHAGRRSPFPALKRVRCSFCAGKKTVGYAICPHCHGSGHMDVVQVTHDQS